jgi:Flp pilus assembly protein TadB
VARRSTLRASDQDRDRIAERLRRAAADGRLLAHEFEDRLARALRARTYGELDELVADLPSGAVERRGRSPIRQWVVPAAALAIAIPVALAVVAAVVVLVASLVAMWAVWMFIAWWFLGRGRHHRRGRSRAGGGRGVGVYGSRRPQPRTGFWL